MRTPRTRRTLSTITPVVNGRYTLTEDSYTSAGIYRKSDPAPKTLLRTLWANEFKNAGTYTLYWDGLDDEGNNIISTNDYEAVVLSHNIETTWNVVGNTSTFKSGGNNYHSYSRFAHIAINQSGNECYLGEYYNEGGARKGFYFDKSIDIQLSLNILPYGVDPNATNPNDTNLETWYNCTDGVNVYWGGIDPSASGYGTSGSWVYGTVVGTDVNLAWSSGTSIKAGFGATYPNAIDIVINQPTNLITGMATDGTYLWVARGSTGNIYCYSCATGALLSTTGGFTNPRELAYDVSNGGRVWFLQGTNQVVKGQVGALGVLTSGPLSIPDFPSSKLTLAIYNAGTPELAVINGGTDQRVWFWDISATTPSGTNTGQIGQVGGYQSTAIVANDRFCFSDNTSSLSGGLSKPYIAYDSNKNLYVGDPGCERLQIFNSSRVHTDTIQALPTTYATSIDMNDATRIIGGYQEFLIDPYTGTWSHSRNYRAQITANYFTQEGYGVFKWMSTLSNGRTYATLDNKSGLPTTLLTELVELSTSGIRYTGDNVNQGTGFYTGYLDKDFTNRRLTSTGWAIGDTPELLEATITGFNGSFNPIYSAETTVVTLDPIAAGDALQTTGYENLAGVVSNDGLSIFKVHKDNDCEWYLQNYNLSTGELYASTARPTTNTSNPPFKGYLGWFPDPRYNDIGNSVANTNAPVQAYDNFIVAKYYGEFWKGAQTNYHNVYYKNGLPITQFGTNRVQAQAIEVSAPQSAGNGFGYRMVVHNGDVGVLTHGDESVHSCVHLWLMANMSSIALQTVQVAPPTFEPLPGVSLMDDVVLNTVLSTTGNITVNGAQTGGFTAQSGNKYYDSYHPEVTVILNAGAATNGDTKGVDLSVTYDPALTSYSFTGDIQLFGSGSDNTIDPTSMMQILDDTGKIIAQIGQGQIIVTNDYEVTANSTVLYALSTANDQDTIVNTIQQWQEFTIEVDSTSVTITYGNNAPVVTTLFDPTADWSKPSKVRVQVERRTTGDGERGLSIKDVRYIEVV